MGNELSYQYTQNSPENKYLYGGKEKQMDFGLDWYSLSRTCFGNYGARFYDPALGRYTTLDPLAEYAFNWTPYRYGFNNPFVFNDPTGMIESQFISDPYLRHLKGMQEGRLAEKKATDTMIELKEVEIVAKKKKKSFFKSGVVLNSGRSLNTSQIRKSLYDTETINLDDIMKYMGFTPGRLSSSPLDIANALAALLQILQIDDEVEPPAPVPTTDKKIKEESTGTGKTPDESGKDYHDKVTAKHWTYIKVYGLLDSNYMVGPIHYIDKKTHDTLRGRWFSAKSWTPPRKNK